MSTKPDQAQLRKAYLLKEDLRCWYSQATPKDARLELLAWRRMVAEFPDAPEFSAVDALFAVWQEEIVTYFTHRVTQGMVEGKNNRAKVIERQAPTATVHSPTSVVGSSVKLALPQVGVDPHLRQPGDEGKIAVGELVAPPNRRRKGTARAIAIQRRTLISFIRISSAWTCWTSTWPAATRYWWTSWQC